MTRTLLLAGLAAFALAGATQAQMMGPPDPDLNRDGKITLAEFQKSQADAMLGRLDKNRDGKIARAEFKTMEDMARRFRGEAAAQRAAQMWTLMDADRDGAVTRAEIEGGAAKRFAQADTDRDGVLDRVEFTSLRPGRPSGGS